MGAPSDLAPWASDIRTKGGKLKVTLRRGLDVNGVLTLIRSQDVSKIRSLKIPGSVGLSGLRGLLSGNRFRSLTSLAINGFADPDDAADLVFETASMARLRVLKVWGVSDAVDMRLARGDFVEALRQLEIRHAPELTSLDRYFGGKRVANLKFLVVYSTGLADASTLFENPLATNLKSVTLARCGIGPDTVDALASSKHAANIVKLNLSYNRDDDLVGAIQKLLRARALPHLDTLVLCGCQLEGYDWDRVNLPKLRRLDLRDNTLDVDEIQDILHAKGMPQLKELVVNTPEGPMPSRMDRRVLIDDRRPSFG